MRNVNKTLCDEIHPYKIQLRQLDI